jgi:hypothetical protein
MTVDAWVIRGIDGALTTNYGHLMFCSRFLIVFFRRQKKWIWDSSGITQRHTWEFGFLVLSGRISAWAYHGVKRDLYKLVLHGTEFCGRLLITLHWNDTRWRNVRGREPRSAG